MAVRDATVSQATLWLTPGTTSTDNAQAAAGSADVAGVIARVTPQNFIAIQQAEAARGPPRSLHNLARDALNAIANRPTQETVDLDTVFPWEAYVAAHKESEAIIGTGITHAHAFSSRQQ